MADKVARNAAAGAEGMRVPDRTRGSARRARLSGRSSRAASSASRSRGAGRPPSAKADTSRTARPVPEQQAYRTKRQSSEIRARERRAASDARARARKAEQQARQAERGKPEYRPTHVAQDSRVQRTQDFFRTQSVRSHALDMTMLFDVLLLIGVGLVALFSASYSNGYYFHDKATYFIAKQAQFAILGLVAMVLLSKFPYAAYRRMASVGLAVSFIGLVLVLTPLGTSANGAQRWLFGFQPSELAKLALIICYAHWMATNPKQIRTIRGLLWPYGAILIAMGVLLYLQPHTSAIMILCAVALCMMIVGGMKLWYFTLIVPIILGALTLFYFTVPHFRARIGVWIDPFQDVQGKGMQGAMSQIAIGSGGIFGLGLGQGRQKHLYLPEPQNDFIFAAWSEEMGLIGAVLLILLFAYLIYRGLWVARNAPDRFGALLAAGITFKIAVQTIMNLFVVTGIMPVTGASLPFFSYGGTALLMQMGEIGILLNISRYTRIDYSRE